MKVRIKFKKYGVLKFIGHLDLMRFFQKAMRRAQIPIAYTGGFSPHMIMSFAQPLGVGITSDGEYLDIELKERLASADGVDRLNKVMTEGIEVLSFREIPADKKSSGMTVVAGASYDVTLPESVCTSELIRDIPDDWPAKMEGFLAQEQILVSKKTKRSEREVDIKPMIHQIRVDEHHLAMMLAAGSEENLKPDLVIAAFLAFIGSDPKQVPVHYHRTEIYAKAADERLVSLESLGTLIL